MKRLILLLLSIILTYGTTQAQTTAYLRNDTIKLTNAAKNTTLVIESASRGHNWYLKDIGNGRTQFVEATIGDISHLQDSLLDKAGINANKFTGTQNMVGQKYTLTYTSPALHVHQGVTFGGGYTWLITSAWIYKCDASFNRLDSVAYATGGNHLGGGRYNNGKLYVAFEQLSGAAFSGQKILVFDATITGIPLLTSYDVSAQNAEVSGVDVNADTLTTISFLDGSRVWKYNKNTGAFIGTVPLSKYMYNLNGISSYNNKYYYFADNGIWTSDLSGNNFALQNIGTDSFLPYNPTGVFESGDIIGGEIRTLIDPSNAGTNPGYGGVVTSYVKYFTPSGTSPASFISPSGDVTAYGDFNLGEPSRFRQVYSPYKYGTREYLKWWIEDNNGGPPLALYHNDNVTGWVRNAWFDIPNNVWRFADSSKYAFRMGYNALGSYQFMMASPTNTSAALTWNNVIQIANGALYPGTDAAISLGFGSTRFLDLQLSGTAYASNFAGTSSTTRFQLVGSTYLSGILQGAGNGDYNVFDAQTTYSRRFDTSTSLWAKIVRNGSGMAFDVGSGTGTTTAGSLRHSLFLSNSGRLGENTQSPTSYHTFTAGDATGPSMNIPVATATSGTVDGGIDRPGTDVLTFQGTSKYKFSFLDNSATPSLGSVPYGSGTMSHAELAPNTAAVMKFYTETGTGSAGQAPAWFNLFDTQNTFTQKQFLNNGNGINVTDGWVLQNPTAATSSSLTQVSPTLRYVGSGWNTGSSTAYTIHFRSYFKPNNNSTSGGKFIWEKSLDGSTWVQAASLDDAGLFTAKSLALTNISTGATGDSLLVKKSSDNKIYKIAATSYATDAAVIHNTGNEIVAGQKTWSDIATFNSSVNIGSLTTIIGNEVQLANSSNSAHLLSIWGGNGSFGPTYGWTWTDSGTGTSLVATQATSNRTITFPDASGTVALTSDIAAATANPYSTSATPSIVVDATHTGTGYTISIAGTNQDGVITLTTGSSPSGVGGFLTVTMSGGFAYPNSCVPVLMPANSTALGLVGHISTPSSSTTSFDISTDQVLTGSTIYKWNYHNGGY